MDGRATGNADGVDSSKEGHEGGRGVTDISTPAESGGTGESMGYNNMTDAFLNKTIGVLPSNNAVTAENMQPILRTVSTINERLLRHGLRNCLR